MSDRTYGATHNCAGCKFWSERMAQSIGGGPVEAMCLADGGQYSSKYTRARTTCDKWESGEDGAVDDPSLDECSESEGEQP